MNAHPRATTPGRTTTPGVVLTLLRTSANVRTTPGVVARAAAVVLLLPLLAATTHAQPGPVRLTLDEVIARALDTSHRVGEANARNDAAVAAQRGRAAADDPTVTVLGGYTRTNHVDEFGIPQPAGPTRIIYPDIPDNWRARVEATWPVYTSGRLPALERAAAAEAKATSVDSRTVRSDVRLDATRAFWTLVMAQASVRVVEDSLARVESHQRDVKAMRDAGLLAPNDVLSVEARRSRERVALIEARNARDVAEADVRRVAGLSPDTAVEIVPPPPAAADTLPPLTDLVAMARSARPEREALELRIQALGSRHAAAAAGQRPTVALVGGADYARPNPRIFPRSSEWNTSFDIGINVAWNAWDGGRARAEVAEADASRRAAEQRLAEFDRLLAFELTQRRLDLESARAAVLASADGVTAAAEAHRVVTDRFKAGLANNTDVMEAQLALTSAEFDRTRAETSARLARARLERALGR